MRNRGPWLATLAYLFLAGPPSAIAGMPAPLPTDYEQVYRLTDSAVMRLQTISFFVMVLLGCAAAVRWLWNSLQRDFPRLPRLGYGKALAGVVLWGLPFVIVLTMIAGARELMTPGAWQKQGFTYKLADGPPPAPEPAPETLRRQRLESLRAALWHFAATHGGRFPSAAEAAAFPPELWEIPDAPGLRFVYLPQREASQAPKLLVYEPELDPERRWVLRTNGTVAALSTAELDRFLAREGRL